MVTGVDDAAPARAAWRGSWWPHARAARLGGPIGGGGAGGASSAGGLERRRSGRSGGEVARRRRRRSSRRSGSSKFGVIAQLAVREAVLRGGGDLGGRRELEAVLHAPEAALRRGRRRQRRRGRGRRGRRVATWRGPRRRRGREAALAIGRAAGGGVGDGRRGRQQSERLQCWISLVPKPAGRRCRRGRARAAPAVRPARASSAEPPPRAQSSRACMFERTTRRRRRRRGARRHQRRRPSASCSSSGGARTSWPKVFAFGEAAEGALGVPQRRREAPAADWSPAARGTRSSITRRSSACAAPNA